MTYSLSLAYAVFCGRFIITVNLRLLKKIPVCPKTMSVYNDSRLSLKHQYIVYCMYKIYIDKYEHSCNDPLFLFQTKELSTVVATAQCIAFAAHKCADNSGTFRYM